MARPFAAEVDMLDVTREMTIAVDVQVRNVWRTRLGLILLRLARWVLGCRLEVE